MSPESHSSPQTPPSALQLEEGDVVDGRYVVGPLVGKGGMGAVYRAVHILRRAPVALKVLTAEAIEVEEHLAARFVREAIAASLVESEHVVRVLDAGTLDNGFPYIVMELLRGRDLAALLRDEGQPGLPIERALHLMIQVLQALQVAHHSKVIHRDLKLSNCFVVNVQGDKDFVKVVDFGGSKLRGSNSTVLTTSNFFLGTPAYIAPEQATSAKDATERSDLFSVGVMTYKLLSNKLPISFENERTLKDKIVWLMTAEVTPLLSVAPHVPESLCRVIHRAMHRDPAARFESALAFAEALEPFLHERSRRIVSAMREGSTAAPPSSLESYPELAAVLASVSSESRSSAGKRVSTAAGHASARRMEAREPETSRGDLAGGPSPNDEPTVTKLVNTLAAERQETSHRSRKKTGQNWVKWGLFCAVAFAIAHLLVERLMRR